MKKTLFFILSLLCNINLVSAKEKGKLDIYYIDTFGDFLSEKVTIEDEIGASFNISPIEIEGYSLVRVDGTESYFPRKSARTILHVWFKWISTSRQRPNRYWKISWP